MPTAMPTTIAGRPAAVFFVVAHASFSWVLNSLCRTGTLAVAAALTAITHGRLGLPPGAQTAGRRSGGRRATRVCIGAST